MIPTVKLVRAVAAEYVRRTIQPLLIAGAVVAVILASSGIWLVAGVSLWWWLFLAPVLSLCWGYAIVSVVILLVVRAVDAVQTPGQKQAVKDYTDMLERTAEHTRMPYMLILLLIAKDVLWPRPDGFVATVSRDSKSLAPDFIRLMRLFD